MIMLGLSSKIQSLEVHPDLVEHENVIEGWEVEYSFQQTTRQIAILLLIVRSRNLTFSKTNTSS